ncbi:MAG: hypothetical protein A3F14_05955 [Gammaproteobacteria bacterium RIFCSPHIGHO2_12_FULL_43_28]|nr:MAG: hypothetical protein A3F14_05955 [Gammaproteobacteria bacterium RIFCSPHIGHO2_12_FULL_43_28]
MPTYRPNAMLDQKSGKIITQILLPLINGLVFKGGGVKGLAYAGFAKVFERYGLLEEVKHVAGSSAGAIAALVVALGYEPDEISQLLNGLNIESFLEKENSWPITPDFLVKGKQAWSLLTGKKTYLTSGNKFLEWLEGIVEKKLGKRDATFKDLAEAIEKTKNRDGNSKFKALYVTGTNISLSIPECEVFSCETEPDMPLALAVRISGSVPFFFKQVTYKGRDYVDGGLLENLPLWIFDRRQFLPKGYDFTDLGANPGTLAVKIDSRTEMNHMLWGITERKEVQYISHLIEAMYNTFSQAVKTREVRSHLAIALPDDDIPMLEFSISDIKKENLITAAEKVTQAMVENLAGAAYSVTLFDGFEDWLRSLTLDDINYIIGEYEKLKKVTYVRESYDEKCGTKDPNHPSEQELKEQIVFLEAYLNHRIKLMRNPNEKFALAFPTHHINIQPQVAKTDWSYKVILDMNDRLKLINEQISKTKEYVKTYCDNPNFNLDEMKYRTGFLEYLKFLFYKQDELRLKLNIPNKEKDPISDNMRKIDSAQFEKFCNLMQPMLSKNVANAVLRTTLKGIELHRPKMVYRSSMESDNVIFTVNLRYVDDRKLFIIALSLFYDWKKLAEQLWLRDIFQLHFARPLSVPATIDELSELLQLNGIDLYVSAFRIEELIHHFEKNLNPNQRPAFTRFISEKALLCHNEEGTCLKNIFSSRDTSQQLFFKAGNILKKLGGTVKDAREMVWSSKNKPKESSQTEENLSRDPSEDDVPSWFLGRQSKK